MLFPLHATGRSGTLGAAFFAGVLVGGAIFGALVYLPYISKCINASASTCNRAERDSGGGFFAGVLVGGAIFGALGYLFAPQISKALLSDDQRLKLPRFLEEEKKSPEATKQVLLTAALLLFQECAK